MQAVHTAVIIRVRAGSPEGRVLRGLAWAAVAVIALASFLLHGPAGRAGRSIRPASAVSARPLSGVLGAGGVLRGAQGSFDARGYRMVLARDGAPRFVRASAATAGSAGGFAALGAGPAQAATGDNFWSDRFGDVGVASGYTVYAVAVSGSNIYIGGNFYSLGAVAANDVAMWNGHGWSPLGAGIGTGLSSGQTVKALALAGGKLYAGGSFTTAGGVSVNNLAMWNGSSWSDVSGGVTVMGSCCASTPLGVNALAVSGQTLYVGGVFNDVGPSGGPITAHSIAAWNTTTSTWSTLASGIQYCSWSSGHCSSPSTGAVYALLVSGSKLYAGGWFNAAGGGEIESLASWDGTNWSAAGGNGIRLGANSIGTVDALAINTSTAPATLYAGGRFDHVGATVSNGAVTSPGLPANAVAQWNGTSWNPLGSGANSCCNPTVYALAYWNGRLFMSGNFDGAGGDATPNIAQWDGLSWTSVGPGLDGTPMALHSTSGGLIAAGYFGTANGTALLNDVGRWNGTAWSGYGLGTSLNAHISNNAPVSVLTTTGRTVYAGGTFSFAGWTPTNGQGLARFDGSSWHAMPGANVYSSVYAVALYGKYVFVAGQFSFSTVNGTANNIAVWDGSQWHALGNGIGGSVRALLAYQGKLWVGGYFKYGTAGAVPASDIATWNLANLATSDYTNDGWSSISSNPTYSGSGPYTLVGWTYSPTEHYVLIGGDIASISDQTGGWIANSLLAYRVENTSTSEFAGYGRFAGANNTVGLTASNGTSNGQVYSLLLDGNNLYVGGAFTEAGDKAAGGLALCALTHQKNGGDCWQSSPGTFAAALGTPTVKSMVKVESAYYLAGNFNSVTDASNNTVSASDIVQYTPATSSFTPLGSGLSAPLSGPYSDPQAYALAQTSDGLYVGGLFGLAGGKPSDTIGLWTGTALPAVTQKASSPADTTGSPVTFTSTVANNSAITWSGLTLTETLPSWVQYDSSSISTTGGSCTTTTTTPVKLTCRLGTLNSSASGTTPASATVAITVTPTTAGKLTNSVTLGASGYSFNNTASTSVTVS